jgi:isopentenyldiphosphate isomerase
LVDTSSKVVDTSSKVVGVHQTRQKRRLDRASGACHDPRPLLDCPLILLFRMQYCAAVSEDLVENEFVHVFGGRFDGEPTPDPSEAEGWRWETIETIVDDVVHQPGLYSIWFRRYVTEFREALVSLR